ncbi:hypothetical protein ABMA28_012679 [Loxostege sticticalis]|uniref:Uncharacterized protein n=1 Tax=Loxostege sticticalis TaxID=481309 RepID=A0ABD0S4N2_LOXSC
MRCCVPSCKNDSKHNSKSEGITFHVFPSEPTLQAAWLQAVGKEDWKPQKRSAVCSEHFLCDDLYETKNGMRKVRTGAVPIILQDSGNCDYGEPASLKVCRICLVVDSKLFPIRKYKLEQAYEHLTGSAMTVEDKLPQKLCYECVQRLLNCARFRTKSLRAMSLMMELVKNHDHLTIQNLKSISRSNNQLTSSLELKHFGTNYYDYLLEDSRSRPKNEVYIEEFDSTLDTEELQNGSIEFSSDDSLPLEVRKRKSEKIKRRDNKRVRKKSREDREKNGEFKCVKCDKTFLDQEEYDCHMITHDELLNQNIEAPTENEISDFLPFENNHNETEIKNDIEDLNTVLNTKYEIDVKVEENYVENIASERDYSSDDSVVLEVKRKKKESKRVKKRAEKKIEPKIDRRRKPFLSDDLNETLFTITDLTYEEQVAEIEKRQESSNYKNAVFKCTECYKGFLDEDAYNSHMLRHTEECGEHRCAVCKTHFKHPHALRKHITAHHTQRFSCKQCPYVTAHRQSARLHERWHKGTKYACPHCPDEFLKFTTYMGHIRIKHPSDFVCQLCGYSFVSEKGIALHKKLKHRQENVPIPEDGPHCELCNIRFIDSEALKRHVSVSARHNSVDKGSREPNKPPNGRKSRESKERDRRAKERREKEDSKMYPSQLRKAEGPIPCEQCGLQLEDSRAYHGHFRRMHPDKNRTNYPSMKSPCMCEVCGRMFQSYALLKDHRWTHTGERPFKCDSCEKSFRMKQRLVAHRRVHSAQKATYVCNVCGKHFSTHSNRQRHMFIHTGLKPFKCEMCGKGFKHASEKRAHITYVHLKKPWPKRSRGKRRSDGRQKPWPKRSRGKRRSDGRQVRDVPQYYSI